MIINNNRDLVYIVYEVWTNINMTVNILLVTDFRYLGVFCRSSLIMILDKKIELRLKHGYGGIQTHDL